MFSRLAQIAYCDDSPDVRSWSCKSCVESNITMEGSVRVIDAGVNRSGQVLLGHMANQSGCFLAIRGSDNTMNWIRDFDTLQSRIEWKDCKGCFIHQGYYIIWQHMERRLLPELAKMGCSPTTDKNLQITGHSLGAGVAQIAMLSLAKYGFKFENSYVFEAPRVGNGKFSDAFTAQFGKRFWRITHSTDPVTHVPFQPMGYYHAGTEVYFDENNNYRVCQGREDPQCMNKHWHVVYNTLFFGAAGEHCANDGFGKNFNLCNPVCSA